MPAAATAAARSVLYDALRRAFSPPDAASVEATARRMLE